VMALLRSALPSPACRTSCVSAQPQQHRAMTRTKRVEHGGRGAEHRARVARAARRFRRVTCAQRRERSTGRFSYADWLRQLAACEARLKPKQ
jgi:hypothetical protein